MTSKKNQNLKKFRKQANAWIWKDTPCMEYISDIRNDCV